MKHTRTDILAREVYAALPDHELVSTGIAAMILARSASTLESWRSQAMANPELIEDGTLPPWVRLGKKSILYRVGDLRAWLESRKNAPRAAALAWGGRPGDRFAELPRLVAAATSTPNHEKAPAA